MIKINEVIVVEGEYDRKKLESIVDATIIQTDGFRIFTDKELVAMLSKLAEKRGLVILTDSDRAGFAIRNRIISSIDKKYIKNAYIPDIPGKEKRKKKPSKEGLLGVEGVDAQTVLRALSLAGVNGTAGSNEERRKITKSDLYSDGLFGRADSASKRAALIDKLGLPKRLTPNKLLDVMNIITTYDEYKILISEEREMNG